MPLYAYRCTACGFEKDVLRKISDPVLTTCPSCQGEHFVKQLTAPGFQLKGTGWYATDFKGGSTAKSAPAASETAPAAASGESSGTPSSAPASPAPCGGSCACH